MECILNSNAVSKLSFLSEIFILCLCSRMPIIVRGKRMMHLKVKIK